MGIFSRKKQDEYPPYTYHSRSVQADAARQLCERLNVDRRRMPRQATQRGPGYQFKFRDNNCFEHSLCIDENGMAVPIADMHRGGVHKGEGGGIMGGFDQAWMMAMQKGQFQQAGQMQMMQAQMQQGKGKQQWNEMVQQMRDFKQHKHHGGHQFQVQPLAHAQQAPAQNTNRPPFRNPFEQSLPQGSYGKREYVPGQETIRVSDYGQRYDDPSTSWNMLQSLTRLRKQNGG